MRSWFLGVIIALLALPASAQTSAPPAVDVQTVLAGPGVYSVRATNRWWGPVQVELTLATSSRNVRASQPLPFQTQLAARATREVLKIAAVDPSQEGNFGLNMKMVPGSPYARHRADYPYRWPLANSAGRMDQGFGGAHSHSDAENYYAIDIAAVPGTPVLAARPGIVMATEDRYSRGGTDPSFMDKANYVRVLHDDGSMGVYVHLLQGSVKVSPGQVVQAGQWLAGVGSTGYASGPHLHFAVHLNSGMQLRSVPFQMYQPKNVARNLKMPAR